MNYNYGLDYYYNGLYYYYGYYYYGLYYYGLLQWITTTALNYHCNQPHSKNHLLLNFQ